MSSYERRPFFNLKIPQSSPQSTVTIPNIDGEISKKIKIEFELHLTNGDSILITPNGTITTGLSTQSHRFGDWVDKGGLFSPQTNSSGNLKMIWGDGTGWHKGKAEIDTKTGRGTRMMDSNYGIRDSSLGVESVHSRGFIDDVTTILTSLVLGHSGSTPFYGNIRAYRLKPEN